MKKVLITGSNSYIGTNLEKRLTKYHKEYQIYTFDMRSPDWEKIDFSKYDIVFHVAALVHIKEKAKMKDSNYRVNRDLPVEVAKRAKSLGVKQFIFMSTMAVYGQEGNFDKKVPLTTDTEPKPTSYYGKSKLSAENELKNLDDDNFHVAILRPPMVYGPYCPGNYSKLEKIARKSPIFPMIQNQRSMIHIDNLCKKVKQIIDEQTSGLFLPQDDEYINTSLLVKEIAEKQGKKIILSKSLGWLIMLFGKRLNVVKKVFGNLIYDK